MAPARPAGSADVFSEETWPIRSVHSEKRLGDGVARGWMVLAKAVVSLWREVLSRTSQRNRWTFWGKQTGPPGSVTLETPEGSLGQRHCRPAMVSSAHSQ